MLLIRLLFCITISSAINIRENPSSPISGCSYRFSMNVTTDDLEGNTVAIGQPVQVSLLYTGDCADPQLKLLLRDAWATDHPQAEYDGSYRDLSNEQKGGFTDGFTLPLSEVSFTMWPIDRSTWQRNNTSLFYARDILDQVVNLHNVAQFNQDYSSLLYGINLVTARTLLTNLTCKNPSPLPNGDITINCTLTPEILGQTMTFYNVTLYFRFDSTMSLLPLGNLNINGVEERVFNLSPSSIPRGPLPVQVHVWIGYDSYTTSPSLPNYPQRNYLSANLDKTSGSIVSFNGSTTLPVGSFTSLDLNASCNTKNANGAACLITNPSQTYNSFWLDATDHTGDEASLMLLLDPTIDTDIFKQTFDVSPNTDYVITFYLLNVLATTDNGTYFGVPNLTLSVNLTTADDATTNVITFELGELPQLDHPVWQHYTFKIHTNAEDCTAALSLFNSYNASNGNDLAIDDVSIYRVVDAMSFLDMKITNATCADLTLNFTGIFPAGSQASVSNTIDGSDHGISVSCHENECSYPFGGENVRHIGKVVLTLNYLDWTVRIDVICPVLSTSATTTMSHVPSTTTSYLPSTTHSSTTMKASTTETSLNATDISIAIKQLMTSLASSRENATEMGVTLTQTLNSLGVVMMRSRSSFNISSGGVSLSGVRVSDTGRGLSLGVKTVEVNVTSQSLNNIIRDGAEANVLLSTTSVSLSADILYSDVIGLSVMHLNGSEISVKNLPHPIQLTVTVLPLSSNDSYHCQFYDEEYNRWSDVNVTTVVDEYGKVTCSTNHLTSFSVGVLKPAAVVESDSESKSTPIGIIVGPAVGGALLLIIVSLVVVFILIRRRRANSSMELEMGVKGQEYEKKTIRVGEQIAGRVYLGHPDTGSFVALKRLSQTDAAKNNRELTAYLKLRHPHIVQFLATYSDDYEYIVLSHMPMGNLHSLVKKGYHGDGLRQIMVDVCSAMRYMEEMQMVHCSLNACCVLVWQEGEEMRGKVSSFGSCRGAGQMSESDVQELAVRWTAPELLAEGRCTSKCMEDGAVPYGQMSDSEVEAAIRQGQSPRPSEPWSTPYDEVYRECTKEGEKRGSWKVIAKMLQVEERKQKIASEDYFDDNLYHGDCSDDEHEQHVSAVKGNRLRE
ncbi:megakaryocyte-associated tyrosine-protein kinase [Planoprotostelium fungivorum]|uniref:Megakaryocyte-associated tyrosine-protein kinase n=1 Tax=Planoprotostelium fungivorum TaxID=1890364 RepID=A0A2P6NTH9_9EUKA|nr:megakaryocyte-associated tyrosine-protein kinase [Planoprotostelium fungivorum]